MPRPSRVIPAAAAIALGAAGIAAIVGATPHPARAATSWPAHVFAPYVDTGLSNTTLTTVAADYGTQFFTLAFVNGSGCQWSLPNQSGWQSQISALQAEGGDVSISFGGYTVDTDGSDLGAQCSSASAMAAQVESVVTTFNVSHLDFDIESNEQYNNADLALTAQALDQVRSWASGSGRQLAIDYTIPVLPTGLTSTGESVLQTALANGFTPDVVNIMTMDYGSSGTEMGSAANQALDATAGQLESLYGISAAAAYARLGNTPMIGQNDTSSEIFTLADASTVESYAAQRGHRNPLVLGGGQGQRRLPQRGLRVLHLQRDQPVQRRLHAGVPAVHHGRQRRLAEPEPDAQPDVHLTVADSVADPDRLVRACLEQRHGLRLGQRGLLQRRQLDRQPVELRRGPGRRQWRLEQRRSLLMRQQWNLP